MELLGRGAQHTFYSWWKESLWAKIILVTRFILCHFSSWVMAVCSVRLVQGGVFRLGNAENWMNYPWWMTDRLYISIHQIRSSSPTGTVEWERNKIDPTENAHLWIVKQRMAGIMQSKGMVLSNGRECRITELKGTLEVL